MLRPKPGKAANWLPTQVAYGVDTSDPDPKNWKPFGTEVESVEEARKHAEPKVRPEPPR